MMKLINKTKNTTVAGEVRYAKSYLSRLIGLLGASSLPEEHALWLDPCDSIHTFFMRFPIDVVFIDRQLQVRAVYENVRPWRFTWPNWKARSAFEMPVGAIRRGHIEVGDQLHVGD